MKKRREDKNDEVVAVGPINETTPVVSAIAGNAFAEFGVSIRTNCFKGGETVKEKGRIIEAVLGGDYETLFWRGRRRDSPGTDGTEIRHDAEDAFWLWIKRLLIGVGG
jgi:hypothetical protein